MPLRLNVGVSKKLGLPEYSSVGAICNLEVELENGILDDLEAFHLKARDAYVACHQAVNDELARLQGPTTASVSTPVNGHRNGSQTQVNGSQPRTNGTSGRSTKPATPSQVRAIVTIARRQRADLAGLLRDDYGVDRAEDLSLAQASQLIDALKAASEG